MKKNKKILLSSQDFGYGPTTQMFAFVKHLLLRGFKGNIYIHNNPSSKIFFNNFVKENHGNNIYLVNTLKGVYDLYVGFYDPHIIFEGKKNKKKTLFLCNLTFLWNQCFVEKYDKNVCIDTIDFAQIHNHHEYVILAYLFADKIFIRNTDGINKESVLFQRIQHKTDFIGPIIYPKVYDKGRGNFFVIQLGGQLNPLTPRSFYEVYLRLVYKILHNLKGNKKILINPHLLSITKNIFIDKNYEIVTTLGQLEYQKLLSHCKCLFSPFGINTFFESSYFDIPTFILPEQHLGHIKSLINYIGDVSRIKENSFLLYNLNKYTLDYENEKDFLLFLEQSYSTILHSNIGENDIIASKLYSNIMNDLNLAKNINNNIEKIIHEIVCV